MAGLPLSQESCLLPVGPPPRTQTHPVHQGKGLHPAASSSLAEDSCHSLPFSHRSGGLGASVVASPRRQSPHHSRATSRTAVCPQSLVGEVHLRKNDTNITPCTDIKSEGAKTKKHAACWAVRARREDATRGGASPGRCHRGRGLAARKALPQRLGGAGLGTSTWRKPGCEVESREHSGGRRLRPCGGEGQRKAGMGGARQVMGRWAP